MFKRSIIQSTYIFIMSQYKPYSSEWHRRRYLKEALDKYLDDYVDNQVIIDDILDILSERSENSFLDFKKINELENSLRKKTTH